MDTAIRDRAPASPPAPLAPTLAGAEDVKTRTAVFDAAIFTGGTYVAQVVTFIAGLVQRALLGPVGAGYWALMQTFWTFFSIAPLGASQGATRQVPLHRGRADFAAAARTAGTAGTFSLAMTTLTGLVVAAVAIVAGAGWAPELRFGLVLLGVTAPLRHLSDLYETVIQIVRRFDVASGTVIIKALCALVLQTLGIVLFGFYGIFAGIVVSELVVFAAWWRMGIISRARPAFRLMVDRGRLAELIRFGAPLLVYGQTALLFAAVDSLIVAGALDVRQLGYYALAVSVTHYVLYLPKTISGVLFPRMVERYARTGSLESIHRYGSETQIVLAFALVPMAVATGYFAFPVVIRHALPEFRPAIGVVEILVAASFFLALMSMPIKVLITAGERWVLTAMMFGCLIVNAALNYYAVAVIDKGIRGAAVATAISYLVALMLTSGYGLRKVNTVAGTARHLAGLLLAFAYTYGALRLVGALIPTPAAGLVADTAIGALQIAVFAALLSPCLWYAERRTGGLTMMVDFARRRR